MIAVAYSLFRVAVHVVTGTAGKRSTVLKTLRIVLNLKKERILQGKKILQHFFFNFFRPCRQYVQHAHSPLFYLLVLW